MAICSATASATSPGSSALRQLRSDSEQKEIDEIDDFEEEERRIMSGDSGPQDSQVGFLVWPKMSKFVKWKHDLT